MPPLPPVAKTLRFDFLQSYGGNSSIRDRLFYQYSGTVSTTDANTLAATARNAWATNLAPNLVTTHSLNAVQVTDLNSNTGVQVVNSTAAPGTAAVQGVPAGTAMVFKLKTLLRYRGGHPRFYLTGMGISNVSAPTLWLPTGATTILNAFTTMVTAILTTPPAAVGTMSNVGVNYFTGFRNVTLPTMRVKSVPLARATPNVLIITGYSVNPKIASQRRRNTQSP